MQSLLIIFILIWIVTVIFTISLAIKKGYNGILAFLLGLFIPLIGSLIIIALLPNKIEKSNNDNNVKKCKQCGSTFYGSYTNCPQCNGIMK